MFFVAALIGGQAVLLILRPDLYLRVMVRGGAGWLNRIPERAYRLWGSLCLAIAIGIVVWVFNTTPGKLY